MPAMIIGHCDATYYAQCECGWHTTHHTFKAVQEALIEHEAGHEAAP